MSTKRIENYDVVIIGGGAAGLTAAIYTARGRLKPLLIEKALVGGLATYTSEIQNYPGFPNNPKGETITNLMKQQARNMGVTFKLTAVESVDFTRKDKIVETHRNIYISKAVIIATGGRPRVTGAKNEENFLFDRGISFCATCDAATNIGKTVVVIGSGDAAIEEGIFLTKFADKVMVSVLHDEGIMDCSKIAKEAALKNEKMSFIWNTMVDSFEGDKYLTSVVLKDVKTNKLTNVPCDTCFEFIGYIPNTEIFKDQLYLTDQGYILTNDRMETNISGIFSAGDVRAKWVRQVATAVGDGAIAGYAAEKYISEFEVFHEIIMQKEKPGLIILYNAIDRTSSEMLTYIKELEKHFEGMLVVNCVDIYKSTGIADRLGVKTFPTLIITINGEITKTFSGEINLDELMSELTEICRQLG